MGKIRTAVEPNVVVRCNLSPFEPGSRRGLWHSAIWTHQGKLHPGTRIVGPSLEKLLDRPLAGMVIGRRHKKDTVGLA